jgi:hypothetical protein
MVSPLSFDAEKQALIASLAHSGSFAVTHSIVGALAAYGYFSFSEATAMLDAATKNNQVNWILSDPDVDELFRKAVIPHRKKFISDEHVTLVEQILAEPDGTQEEAPSADIILTF